MFREILFHYLDKLDTYIRTYSTRFLHCIQSINLDFSFVLRTVIPTLIVFAMYAMYHI